VVALCGSVNCPPEAEPDHGDRKRLPACELPLVRFPSPSELPVRRVAPCWLPALPPRRSERPRGLPLRICSRGFRPVSPLVEFRSSPESLRVPTTRPGSPFDPHSRTARFPRAGYASPGLLAPGTPLPRAPRSPRDAPFQTSHVEGEVCQVLAGAVLRVGSLSTDLAASRAVSEPCGSAPLSRRPEASRPCFMPLASLESPFRAFPSRGAVPALAGPCFLASSRSTTAGAARASPSQRFHLSADPLPRFATRAHRTTGPGQQDSRVARRDRRTCFRTPTASCRSLEPGSPVSRRHARFEALLPSRVRSLGSNTLAGVRRTGSVLSWDSSPLELAPTCTGCGLLQGST